MTELATPPVERDQDVKRISHWIGGRVVEGQSGRNGPVYNPALGRQTGEVDFATREEIDLAVQTAREAFPAWRAMSLSKRTALFFAVRELFDHHREDIARLLTAEHGKVLSDALGEVARGLEVIEYCCGIPELLKGEFSEQASTGIDVYSIRQPLGVVAGITPFNFPAMVPMWMWAPALACGNTFVLKPSEKDPGASLYMADLLKEAGLPDGSVVRLTYRGWFDPERGLEHTDDRYERLVDGRVVEEERNVRSPATRHYEREAIQSLHEAAGFADLEWLSGFTRTAALPGDRVVTTLARRPD